MDQLIAKGNTEVIDIVFSTGYVAIAGGKRYTGHEFLKRFAKQLRSAIPDIKVAKLTFHIESENSIVWQRTLVGTHKRSMGGIPPSGKKIKWDEMVVSHFKNGRIAKEYVVSELAGKLSLAIPKDRGRYGA